ncbi:MAG: hypothetical protein M1818_000914 [Claussenomyces sp. TS43310]|nr:MAG: hypothetical protein M1818_000914 [Claussenomyces sp. TS43310]
MDDQLKTSMLEAVQESSSHAHNTPPETTAEQSPTSTNIAIPGLGMLQAEEPQNEPTVPQTSDVDPLTESSTNTIDSSMDTSMLDQTKDDSKADQAQSPPVTLALEAMLGGITPPTLSPKPSVSSPGTAIADQDEKPEPAEKEDTDMSNAEMSTDATVSLQSMEDKTDDVDAAIEAPPQAPTVDSSAAPILLDIPDSAMLDVSAERIDTQEAEFEIDSSPIEDSSDDSSDDSDDSSSSEDSDAGEGYELLSPEEQARILMQGDGGSDDEGGTGKGGKGTGAQLRTKNEVPEEVIPKPDVVITPEMTIKELGTVEAIVESILLIKATTSGEYRVLESGSVLCIADRSVIGVVAETLGRVQQPLYSVRFTNAAEIAAAGLSVGTKVFYSEQHSTYVFTEALRAYKGSDASNLHDEEVGDEEVEFSDDEAEAEHKKRLKQKKMERRGGRAQQNGGGGGAEHPLRQEQKPYDSSLGLSYDDADDDGPYKPLARPVGFANTVGRSEAPQEGVAYAGRGHKDGREENEAAREQHGRGRGRGDRSRGRGDRGRGHDRGRGRGGFSERRGDSYAQPPRDARSNGYAQPPPQHPAMPSPYPSPAPNSNSYAQASPNHPYSQSQPQYLPPPPHFSPSFHGQQPQAYPVPPASSQQQYQYPYAHPTPSWPSMPPQPVVQNGGYINPAFFGQQQQQQQQQQYQPQAGVSSQWGAPAQAGGDAGLADLLRHLQRNRGGHGGGS